MERVRGPYQPPHQPPQGENDQEQHAEYAAHVPQGFPKLQGYGWGQLQQDMASLRLNQTEFFESIQAQQVRYGQDLHELKVLQHDIWADQTKFYQDVRAIQEQQQQQQYQQLQADQAHFHKEFTNHKKNFLTHMGKVNKSLEEHRANITNLNAILLRHTVDSEAQNMYTNWGLQQGIPSLAP
ncbi:hypothetical protein PIB30_088966 [Stylosanthes scabra]|uniref:Uncharacterized protein n=1 Tax=Stylosanthes scabra TaxID=79078 RepID=A0ABU6ZSG5_9FABA|nr:hypothetical protein [Stylosanthes scabra]